jgi:pyruvate/2-oxoglutarate dehydrogenase complex dihydrolipoamide dehydrogenase (E3) component
MSNSESLKLAPWDTHNQTLASNVHPADWVNPSTDERYNLVVIGAGTAGLVTAAGAAGLGAKVALIERHLIGGDCLNVGCVPSKAVIRASRAYADVRDAGEFGIEVPDGVKVNFGKAMERMRRLRSKISFHDSAQRFKSLGVDIYIGDARFSGPDTIQVNESTLRFKKAVITSGARAVEPPIEGLKEAGFLTNETVFNLTERPKRLACVGAGPIGCELAQAFRRLGSEVVLFHHGGHILNREDADAAEIVQQVFIKEGIQLILNSQVKRVVKDGNGKTITFTSGGHENSITVDEILIGVGRAPNVEGLNLEGVGVEYDNKRGVFVNDYLQTTNPRVFAAGDICMNWKFTHAADAAARIVIQNALFFKSKKLSSLVMPWCTYTDPEIAHVGLYERDAQAKGIEVTTIVRKLEDVDRAITDGQDSGFVKVHLKKGTDQILGATIVASHAGDMISEVTLAITSGIGLGKISSVIHPYPTQAEAIKQTADAYNRTRLTPFVKGIFETWLRWSR